MRQNPDTLVVLANDRGFVKLYDDNGYHTKISRKRRTNLPYQLTLCQRWALRFLRTHNTHIDIEQLKYYFLDTDNNSYIT